MFEFKVSAQTIDELKSKIVEAAKSIEEIQVRIEQVVGTVEIPTTVAVVEHEPIVKEVKVEEKAKRTRKKKEETSASVVPEPSIIVPPVPTTDVVVEIPKFDVPVAAAPIVATPVVEEAPAVYHEGIASHSFETFKSKIVIIVNDLVAQNKIDRAYIEQVCKHFNVSYIWDVAKDDSKAKELYEGFCQFGFINKVQV